MLRSASADGARVDGPSVSCIVCGASALDPSRLTGLMRCRSCGFVTANLALADKDLAALYGKDYFHGSEYFDYLEERESLRLNFTKRLETLAQLAGGLRGRSLLEVGCAYGFFLELAGEKGLEAHGIDITVDGVRYANERLGVRAQMGDYLSTTRAPVDLVTMWDTVEHLPRPDLFVAKAARELAPGGLLAITTGDIGSFNARMRKGSWRMIHPPTHLHYFSVPTISLLLQRNGLDVVHVSHPGVSRRLHAMSYMIFDQRLALSRLHRAMKWLLPDVPITVNLFDVMFVVARKPYASAGAPA